MYYIFNRPCVIIFDVQQVVIEKLNTHNRLAGFDIELRRHSLRAFLPVLRQDQRLVRVDYRF